MRDRERENAYTVARKGVMVGQYIKQLFLCLELGKVMQTNQ